MTNGSLSYLGRNLGIDDYINTNPSQKTAPPGDKLIADTMEALFGAAKLDGADDATLEGIMETLGLL